MRSLHDLRRARRNGILDNAGKLIDTVRTLKRLPESIEKLGNTADAINQSKLPQSLSNTSGEIAGAVKVFKYVCLGVLGIGVGYVLKRRD